MEALTGEVELGKMDDLIRIKESEVMILNYLFQNPSFMEEESCAILFGGRDEDGNICFSLCAPRKKISSLSKDNSNEGIICGISKMANSYANNCANRYVRKKKMVCCIVNISPDEKYVSDEFLKTQHSKCLDIRNKLSGSPTSIGCVFGYGSFDSVSGQPILRLFCVDSVGILEYKNIETYEELLHLPEVIINECNRAK